MNLSKPCRAGKWLLLLLAVLLPGCTSYFESGDPYVSGMRWFNHKQYAWARKDWEPLARNGDCDAQYRIGTLYFLGAGVPQDYAAARDWWTKAANQGQSFAQALLATMSAHETMEITTIRNVTRFDCTGGCGCEKNMVEAFQWMRLAENCAVYEDTRRSAAALAERYKAALTAGQIAEADRLVRAWKPFPAACRQRQLH